MFKYHHVQVSSFGRVKFPDGRISDGTKNGPYKRVNLVRPNSRKIKSFFVHRLVAAAFYGINDDPNIVVNHKDGNKKNNVLTNLEYITHMGNVRHAHQLGLFGSLGTRKKHKIIQSDLNGNMIAEYESIIQASRQTGFGRYAIGNACRGKSQTSGGFKWQYA